MRESVISRREATARILLVTLAAWGLFACSARPACGAIYYVAQDGSDRSPGTETAPWRTVQKAAETAKAGDTVYIKQGTSWNVKVDAPGVRVGTRSRKGEAYLILVNQTSRQQNVTLTLDGLSYPAKEVRDYFNDKKVTTVLGNAFSLILPGIDVGSGTTVLRIVPSASAG